MKRVLFVSDYFMHGGLETRILELVDFYRRRGIESFLACNTMAPEHQKEFVQTIQLPFHAADFNVTIKNTDALVAFCREHKIDMIDCQPLYGLIPAILASSVQHIPLSYTSHGLFTFPPAEDALNPLFYSLLELKQPQVFVVAEYLSEVYEDKFRGCKIDVARNGVSLSNLPKLRIGKDNKWAYAARLSTEKTEPLIASLPLLEEAGVTELDIFGEGECKTLLEQYISEHPSSKLKLNLRGWRPNLQEQLAKGKYTGFFGMGRTTVEAMTIGLPAVILGYNGLGPAVCKNNFLNLLSQNFSDNRITFGEDIRFRDAADIQRRPEDYNVQALAKEHLDSDKIWGNYLKIVENIPLDSGRDSMIGFWWERFYKSILLEQAMASKEEQVRVLSQRVHALEDAYPRKLARKIKHIVKTAKSR